MLSPLVLLRFSGLLIVISIASSTYLYLYPLFHQCQFPAPPHGESAPFRLLAFGDPQLEGDTSLPSAPDLEHVSFSPILDGVRERDFEPVADSFRRLRSNAKSLLQYNVEYARKHLDLIGNDYYLAHIYRTLHWWSGPTHLTVLGDLLGSQWIDDEEFDRRSARFWNRVFRGTERVPSEVLDANFTGTYEPHKEILGEDARWSTRLINVAGNHDIGYSGDITEARIERFERAFGPVNGDLFFTLPSTAATGNLSVESNPSLRIVVLNSMNIDGPAFSYDLQVKTVDFVNAAMHASAPVEDHSVATILLTHIPLHKPSGVCVDDPFFSYFDEENGAGVKEQNLLSEGSSRNAILQGIFGKSGDTSVPARGIGRDGIILTGHDHEGCDVYHFVDRETGDWQSQRWDESNTTTLLADEDLPGLREVTLRSMMGDYGGNAGLISAWWDKDTERWKIEVATCQLGVQHVWWAVHILLVITSAVSILAALAFAFQEFGRKTEKVRPNAAKSKPRKDRKPLVSTKEKKS